MSTSAAGESAVLGAGVDGPAGKSSGQSDVVFAKCDCCGLTEECTPSYIDTIRERYWGKWICGLCAEAVKDEMLRCESLEEALALHSSFCNKSRAAVPPHDPTVRLIRAMSHILRRSLDSPNSPRSLPASPRNKAQVLPDLAVDG